MRVASPGWIDAARLDTSLKELAEVLSSQAQRLGEGPAQDEIKGAADLLSAYRGALGGCVAIE